MRASSLSDDRIIDLLSKYFVSVWLSTDDYELEKKDQAEADEYMRYRRLAKDQGLAAGNVQIYLILPDGKLLTTMHIAQASKPEKFEALLKDTIDQYKLQPREVAKKTNTAARPRPKDDTKDALVFHIAARHLGPRANWGLAENWVTLDRKNWATFVPRDPKVGSTWEIRPETARKLFMHFYPPGPNYKTGNGAIEESSLTAKVTAVEKGRALVTFTGDVKMSHNLATREGGGAIKSKITGYALVDTAQGKLTELALITESAELVWSWQGTPQPLKFAAFVECDAAE
jgi:hypothetical protein